MKLVRFGAPGREKPGMLDAQGRVRDLSKVVPSGERNAFGMTASDFHGKELDDRVFAVAQKLGLTNCRMFFSMRGCHPAPGH